MALLLQGRDSGFDGVDGFLEFDSLLFAEFEVERADNAVAAEDGWEAIITILEIVVGGNWEDTAFVTEDAVDNLGETGADAVVGCAFFVDDVVNFVFGELFDLVEDRLGEESGDRLTASVGERPETKLGVAMFADLVGVDRLRVEI